MPYKKDNIAPILVSVYIRYEHFVRCIESLKKCELSDKSHLFIAIDAPYRDEDKIINNEIIEYSKSIYGFKEITLFIRSDNLGALANRKMARDEIFNTYDKLIQFEDDNIFSPNFLKYLNDALEFYKDDKRIFSISGYNYPINIHKTYKNDIYIWHGFSAWGVGIWKEKWYQLDWNIKNIMSFLYKNNNIKLLKSIAEGYYEDLKTIIKTGKLTGDTVICYNLVKNNMYSIFPVISKVRNTGYDGSGENCGTKDIYMKQVIDDSNKDIIFLENIEPDPIINKKLHQFFKKSFISKVISIIPKRVIIFIKDMPKFIKSKIDHII